MKTLFKIIFFLFFIFLLGYILPPGPTFPEPMSDFYQSGEPADVETLLRRGYYTNATRQEVMDHYMKEFEKPTLWGIPFLTYALNYPPEEAQTLIRDQTKSTFLQEIVHPLRESVYINGFEPDGPEYAIVIKETPWRQKIIVRYVPSNLFSRVLVICLSGFAVYFLLGLGKKKLK